MKSKFAILGFLTSLVSLSIGCRVFTEGAGVAITGSGNLVTQEEDISDFNRIDASHAFKVDISQSDAFKVVIRIDDNLLEHVRVVKPGKTLHIGLKPGIRSVRDATMEAEITLPELIGLDLSGASHATLTDFESTRDLDVKLSGASHLVGNIEAGDLQIDISGASHMTLSGSAQDVTIDSSGASKVDLSDLSAADARVEASGASNVTVNPSGRLDVDASGASHVYYLGNPTLGDVETSGASSVRHK